MKDKNVPSAMHAKPKDDTDTSIELKPSRLAALKVQREFGLGVEEPVLLAAADLR